MIFGLKKQGQHGLASGTAGGTAGIVLLLCSRTHAAVLLILSHIKCSFRVVRIESFYIILYNYMIYQCYYTAYAPKSQGKKVNKYIFFAYFLQKENRRRTETVLRREYDRAGQSCFSSKSTYTGSSAGAEAGLEMAT